MHARHILILADEKAPADVLDKAKTKIQEIEKRIQAGEDFAELAKEYSQDGSAALGGDLAGSPPSRWWPRSAPQPPS